MASAWSRAVNGLRMLAWSMWGLQERRFSIAFEVMSSAMASLTASLILCFVFVHSHQHSHFSSYNAMIYIQS